MAKTLFEKVWERHVAADLGEDMTLLYIDRHLIHEVTSPQAFEGLRLTGRTVRRPELTFATMDHNVPTDDRFNIKDPVSKAQIAALQRNCDEFGVTLYNLDSEHQGIVHVIGPDLGITLPGMTIVCGDSHTSTHGAFGTLAFGIGTSEVEHVMATQTLRQSKPKTFKVSFDGTLGPGVTAKDMILKLIGEIGTAGGTGHVLEYTGDAIAKLSMEERMTICNMSIEAGARAGMIAPDETTFAYISRESRPFAPKGAALDAAIADWKTLPADPGAVYDRSISINVDDLEPQITWGTSPGMVTNVSNRVPNPGDVPGYNASDVKMALEYMGLTPGTPMTDIKVDTVFIGSCTNGRLDDLRRAANVLKNHKVAPGVRLMVVPGSEDV
ncbi:MAG: 3-isopropylmalate/(R)-2-methylmalate dehydratase large subunit, partial [Kiritimatiellia bacterium]